MCRSLSLALVFCIGVCAFAQAPKKRYINLPNKKINAPFSDAVLVGDTLYIAGRVGLDPRTGKVPDDVGQEARNVLESFRAVLAQANMNMDDLVSVQVFSSDLSLFGKWNDAYRSYFKKDFPPRAFIASNRLLLGAHFEMQGTAVKGGEAALKKKLAESDAPHGN
jgi:2-iminobutanoate/2-iminopropanoate deaminase